MMCLFWPGRIDFFQVSKTTAVLAARCARATKTVALLLTFVGSYYLIGINTGNLLNELDLSVFLLQSKGR